MGFTKKGLDSIDVKDKRVLMRVDFNVPMENGKITNTKRIEATLPSIKHIMDNGAKALILMSHLGRPDGVKKPEFTLKPVAEELEKLLGRNVTFLNDCIGEEIEKACADPAPGSIILLENVRFHPEEEGAAVIDGKKVKADPADVKKFRESLTKLGDVFVNDAFGTAHRAHSTMVGVNLSPKVAGFLMKKELDYFAKAFDNVAHPYIAILGGAKVSDKIPIIKNFIEKTDKLILCGGIALTFKKVLENTKIGNSLFDEKSVDAVKEMAEMAKQKNVEIILPCDWVIGTAVSADSEAKVVTDKEGIPEGWMGLDEGPETRKKWETVILTAKTIFWNGPPGVFEIEKFSEGSKVMSNLVVEATKKGCTSIVGGGDTPTALKKFKLDKEVSHISTGGGASMELIQGLVLPGIDYLDDL